MKPFLLLSHRPEDTEAEREHTSIAGFAALDPGDVDHRRLDKDILGAVDLDDYSGVIIGGGPFNVSDTHKSDQQRRVEQEMAGVVAECLERDFPFLGICYGMGILVDTAGGKVERRHGESASAPWIALTPDGDDDPLLNSTPELFQSFTGHKESVTRLPDGAVVLASNAQCPIQMIRMQENVYAVQFHPELDGHGLAERLLLYEDLGYVPAGQADTVIAWARATEISGAAHNIIQSFVERYSRD